MLMRVAFLKKVIKEKFKLIPRLLVTCARASATEHSGEIHIYNNNASNIKLSVETLF
jgi:hypothetical protein